MEKMSREKFEKFFKRMNASWAYENAQLNDEEKELLFKKLNGEISEEEYDKAILQGKK